MDEDKRYTGHYRFSYKTAFDHLRGLFSNPTLTAGLFFATFGTIWTITEATTYFTEVNVRGFRCYLSIFVASCLVTLVWRVNDYMRSIPDGLESCNRHAGRIAHLQRPMWEFKLAQSLLAEKVAPIDRECADILTNRLYVPAKNPSSDEEYFWWLSGRTGNLKNMCEVAQTILIEDFPAAVASTELQSADPVKILATVDSVARLYRGVVDFEKESLQIIPPDLFAQAHQLQMGFSKPIRDGILQLFDYLQKVADLNPKETSELQYTLEFGEIPNIDEFSAELERIEAQF